MTDSQVDQFAVDNPNASLCGKNTWTIQMTNGQQMIVSCESVEIEQGVVGVYGYDDEPLMYLPSGSWVAVYRSTGPAKVALPLTHLVSPQVFSSEETPETPETPDESTDE